MKTEIPPGDYRITLEHHPNQRPLSFVATIIDGKHTGKGMNINVGTVTTRCVNLVDEVENEN